MQVRTIGAVAGATAALATFGAGGAAQAAGTFKCTATGAKVGATSFAVANPGYGPCVRDQAVEPVDLALPANPLFALTGESVYARTVPNPRVNAQAYAAATVVNVRLLGQEVRLEIVESSSSVGCSPADRPFLFNRGGVTDLHINGTQVIDLANTPLSFSVPGLGSLDFNQTTKSGSQITFTAFKLTPPPPFPVITLADTKAGFSGNPCTP